MSAGPRGHRPSRGRDIRGVDEHRPGRGGRASDVDRFLDFFNIATHRTWLDDAKTGRRTDASILRPMSGARSSSRPPSCSRSPPATRGAGSAFATTRTRCMSPRSATSSWPCPRTSTLRWRWSGSLGRDCPRSGSSMPTARRSASHATMAARSGFGTGPVRPRDHWRGARHRDAIRSLRRRPARCGRRHRRFRLTRDPHDPRVGSRTCGGADRTLDEGTVGAGGSRSSLRPAAPRGDPRFRELP